MKHEDLTRRTKEELEKMLNENAEKLQKLRFDVSFSRLKDITTISKLKKEIARIKTLLNQK